MNPHRLPDSKWPRRITQFRRFETTPTLTLTLSSSSLPTRTSRRAVTSSFCRRHLATWRERRLTTPSMTPLSRFPVRRLVVVQSSWVWREGGRGRGRGRRRQRGQRLWRTLWRRETLSWPEWNQYCKTFFAVSDGTVNYGRIMMHDSLIMMIAL